MNTAPARKKKSQTASSRDAALLPQDLDTLLAHLEDWGKTHVCAGVGEDRSAGGAEQAEQLVLRSDNLLHSDDCPLLMPLEEGSHTRSTYCTKLRNVLSERLRRRAIKAEGGGGDVQLGRIDQLSREAALARCHEQAASIKKLRREVRRQRGEEKVALEEGLEDEVGGGEGDTGAAEPDHGDLPLPVDQADDAHPPDQDAKDMLALHEHIMSVAELLENFKKVLEGDKTGLILRYYSGVVRSLRQ